ncbi:hypothetical protein Avbf_10241 [Armadillidium vulgare]|nr:hypothetical protein Avbf_10241 [Armadillidium vulgare]
MAKIAMTTPAFQLTKNLSLFGLNLRPYSDYQAMHRFIYLADYRKFCNKMGVRLNYTNASSLIKYTQFGHKFKGSDRPERKQKFKFQDMLGKHLYAFGTDMTSILPVLVECNRSISNSLDIDTLIQKKNEKSETEYVKKVFLSGDDVKRLYEDGNEAQKKFNINSIFSNSAILLNAVTLPSCDIFNNVYSYNCSSNNVNEINDRVLKADPSNMSLERVFCSPASTGGKVPSPQQDSKKNLGKPSDETLLKVSNALSQELRSLFTKTMNYRMYTNDLIFDNRIRGKVTVGIFPYIRQISFLRIFGHIKFAYVEFEILKITQNLSDGTIRVRWRIIGSSALKSLPFIFSLKSYSLKDAKEKMDTWYDGFSTFYVNEEGLIYKHIADKMMPDEEPLVDKNPSFISRLIALIGRTLKKPAPSPPAVTTSVVEDPKDKTPSQLSGAGAQKSSLVLLLIGNKIFDTFY